MSDEMKLEMMKELTKGVVKIENLILEVTHFYNKSGKTTTETQEVTDEQISQAIMAINGDKKPLNEKQLFLGVLCVLISKYGWNRNWTTCCNRINDLPMKSQFEKQCDYNSIKVLTAFRFASTDYKDWEKYEPSESERMIFMKCKSVADAFENALSKQNELIF